MKYIQKTSSKISEKTSKISLIPPTLRIQNFRDITKKSVACFKDETGGKIISEFVELRAKSYAFDMDSDEFKKCKGVKNML